MTEAQSVPKYDVLALGIVAAGEVGFVEEYPRADAKVRVVGFERSLGGLTGQALTETTAFGGRCAYAGPLCADHLPGFIVLRMAGPAIRAFDEMPKAAVA